ncbi:hypothetical protein [Cardinium endosymbiont of Sogatella furcifera]|uniref:hypothetical protein n=1 Tax=Cardinium endosymbiont of Sogatella furcifera TaxID=650378 RepID=UPI0013B3FE6A|nr:hypothetical protein [Cardinium endosymbiont of Sogatella furcifera]
MFLYHLRCICWPQKKQRAFWAISALLYFLFFGLATQARAIQKIATPHFSIFFDKNTTKSAQRIANTLETIYKPVSKTLGIYPSPLRLLLNNQSTELNAYFKLLPRHISFDTLYNSNPYFVGNADWYDMLCIHELRHAVQHSIEYHSTPVWLKFPYFAWNMVAVCGVDSFFKEGDAVGMETALSKSGRGRLPGWEKIYKVTLLERDPVSFSRQVFGSLKYELPSDYHVGYYFTTHMRRKYGADVIKAIFEKTMQGVPYFGFHHAVKKVTKKSIPTLYREMNQELRDRWQKQLEGLKITPATQLTVKKPNDSFDYHNPFMDASGRLMAWKIGIGLRAQLVHVKLAPADGLKRAAVSLRKDKTILHFMPSSLTPTVFDIGEGCAAWLETCRHPWQGNRQTIRLQYYDFAKKSRRTLASSSRYTALAISPSAQQLVAVTTDQTGKHLLVILETKSGKVIKKIDNLDEGYYLTPSWSGEDHILVVKTKDQQNSILRIHVATSKAETLLPYTYEHRSSPKIYKDYLLYNSAYNGIDNIYAMHLPTKACFQVTSRKYGAYLGRVDPLSNQLIFNDYGKNGMEIAAMPFDPLLWTPLEAVEDRSVRYYAPLVVQEQNSDLLTKVPDHRYPIIKHHFLNEYFDLLGPEAKEPSWHDRGIKVILCQVVDLEDKLNIAPYFYQNFNILNKVRNTVYKTTELGLKIKYATFYPILDIDIKGTRYKNPVMTQVLENRKKYNVARNILAKHLCSHESDYISDTFWEPTLKLGIKFPYYFTLGSSSGEAYFKAEVELERCDEDKKIAHTEIYSFNITHASSLSKRDLCSPWYQKLYISFARAEKYSPLLREWENILIFNPQFYIPGFGDHHYFSLDLAIRRYKPLSNHLYLTYGLPLVYKESPIPRWEQYLHLTYGFPLAYPECGIPLFLFLEKIWMEWYGYTPKIGAYDHTLQRAALSTIGRNFDTIGAKLHLKCRFLSNRNIPYANISVDLPCLKKQHNNDKWVFQLPMPIFGVAFHLEARKEVE